MQNWITNSLRGLCLTVLASAVQGEMVTQPTNGIIDHRDGAYAFTHGIIVKNDATTIEDSTLLIRKGKVEKIAKGQSVPEGFIEVDLEGRYLYPGFLDIYTQYGLPEQAAQSRSRFRGPEVVTTTTPGAYNANEAIKSYVRAGEMITPDAKAGTSFRSRGVTTVLSFQADGLARGTSALVNLQDGFVNDAILISDAATHYSLNKGSAQQFYPVSRMGSVSVLRQTYLDADWYGSFEDKPFTDLALDAWLTYDGLPKIFEAVDWKTLLLADKVGDEFGDQFVIRSGGDEYQRLDEVKATGATLIVDVAFPEAPDVADPFDADLVSVRDLKHWELAPYNLGKLEAAGVPFVITTEKADKDFLANLRMAVEKGLSKSAALQAMTVMPAKLLGVEDQVGSLSSGHLANFFIADGDLFEKDSRIEETWVAGQKFQVQPPVLLKPGTYELSVADNRWPIDVKLAKGKYKASFTGEAGEGDSKPTFEVSVDQGYLQLQVMKDGMTTRLGGWQVDNQWSGAGIDPKGTDVSWKLVPQTAEMAAADESADETMDKAGEAMVGEVIYPFRAYGRTATPEQKTLLFKGATVWTNEADGVLVTDVLIRDGKIAGVGDGLKARDAEVIDAEGMHLTPGIIDEHSHIALDAVNEFATNSSMVRMADVLDSEDVGIYLDLAGGTTAAQLLHGSANPVGGQSAIIKMRWGRAPQELLIKGADPFIKFALGENVKRSSNQDSIRFPQTRMGVEQVYVDAFSQAREYEAEWLAYESLSRSAKRNAPKPRRDLVHETMLQILNGERFITSHSYVQSEINMLMHVADQFDFTINTFTHILEGYKVADKMVEHGVGGSTFSDWWAYKWEVRYAIPYNAALMHQAGVTVAINSDDAEMSRRLNQEAAKTVKYGGLSEEEALKLVTLNPAKLLHLDDRMGSIKVGKDADLVLWTDHPLSVYAKAQKTLVDGRIYFDREEDEQLRVAMAEERNRLIQKIRAAANKKGDGKGPKPKPEQNMYFTHDDIAGVVGGER